MARPACCGAAGLSFKLKLGADVSFSGKDAIEREEELLAVRRQAAFDEQSFYAHLQPLTNLTNLNVWGTAITDAGVARLSELRPDLEIER